MLIKNLISVIVPCYNEEQSLADFMRELNKMMVRMQEVDFEVLLINDGSKDNTLNIMKEMAEQDNRIIYFSFSKILEKRLQFMLACRMQEEIILL